MGRGTRKYQANNRMERLWGEVSEWSQATFGSDDQRGPHGPLKHMKLEVDEAIDAHIGCKGCPVLANELADILILLCDASRRAKISQDMLLGYALAKMELNRSRTYPKPKHPDDVSEHDRGKDSDRPPTLTIPGME